MTSYDFKKKFLPLLIKLGIGLGIGLFVVIVTQGWFFELTFLKNIDLLTVDIRYQSRYEREDEATQNRMKNNGDVVIVGISDEDLKAMPEKFPFPRSYYAHLIENLNRAGARAIVFDMTFESPSRGDTVLRETLQKYNNVVLAVKSQTGAISEQYEIRSIEQKYDNVFFDVDKQLGVVNIIKDRDDVCRRYLPMVTVNDNLTPTLAFAALNRYYNLQPLTRVKITGDNFVLKNRDIPRYDPSSFMLSYYGPVETFRYIGFRQVINDETFSTKDELELGEQLDEFDEGTMKLFKNKIVLIGSTMPEERDYHNVPIPKVDQGKSNYTMHGVEIHATAIQNVIDGNFIQKIDPSLEIVLTLLLSIGSFFGLYAIKQIHFRYVWLIEIGTFVIVLLLIGAVFELSLLTFSSNGILVNIVNPSFAIVLSYFGTAVYQYLTERQQKALIKNVFGHYLSPTMVNMLANDPDKAKLGGDRRELTVFFSDIANFTTVSESFKQPEGLVELLNEYLEEMTSVVLKYEGTLDKYVGDAIIAFWGAPMPQKDHVYRGCIAALEMQKRLAELRPKWKKEGRPELSARCGLNTGVMIVGNIGGKDRFDYTVIGDSVNLASRLEGANKQYHSNIMISEFTYNHVKGKVVVRELDLIQVKGKTEPVKVFELLGKSDMPLTEAQKQSIELYHEGLKLYRQRKWEEAIAYMSQAHQLDPSCYSAQIYQERASLYQLTPPPDDWNGVFVMTTK
ncbi:MAG: CHASE2 domain-containing protein [Bacteroidota bacterium]